MASGELHVAVDIPRRGFRVDVKLAVAAETVALVGPSGAGKSSVLRAIAGLDRPSAGRITLGGDVWFDSAQRTWVAAERRSVGLVFQDYALFPHLTVRENVGFGGRDRVDELLDKLRIEHLAAVRPGELSGGERQRVALARALAREPSVLLLDEPMAALDAHTKATVRGELRELLAALGLPTLVVSHDFDDAAALAGRIAVLEAGHVVQIGSPAELVARPVSAFVASLTGANLIEGGAVAAGQLTSVELAGGAVVHSTDRLRGRVGVVVHPVDVSVTREVSEGSTLNHVPGRIESIVVLGSRARVQVGRLTAEVTTSSVERLGLEEGQFAVASFKAVTTRLVPLGVTPIGADV